VIQVGANGRCVEKPYFFDDDGDGWGIEDDAHPRQLRCQPDLDAGFVSRNARDCDDNDDQVTGMVGAICPQDMTIGDTTFVGFVGGESEYIAVLDPTPASFPFEASSSCEFWGYWDENDSAGAWLATFNSLNEVSELQTLVEEAGHETYAAFLGIDHDGSAWGWQDDASLSLTDISPCGGVLPDVNDVDDYQQLALVRPEGGGEWCLGTPADAGSYAHDEIPETGLSPDYYAPLYGHYICERPLPDSEAFQVPPPGYEGAAADTAE